MRWQSKPRRSQADRTSASESAGGRKSRGIFRASRLAAIVALATLCIALVLPVRSQTAHPDDQDIRLELAAMEDRGGVIARVREQTLLMLETDNACTAWFRDADPDPAGVFRSLHYELGEDGPSYVFHRIDRQGGETFKHPWAARTYEGGGRNSVVVLNPSGPFFRSSTQIVELGPQGLFGWPRGNHQLLVASFSGKSPKAQVTTLLHEFGHVTGRIPADDDSWDGRSSRNTEEVLKHCKHEIQAVADRISRGN